MELWYVSWWTSASPQPPTAPRNLGALASLQSARPCRPSFDNHGSPPRSSTSHLFPQSSILNPPYFSSLPEQAEEHEDVTDAHHAIAIEISLRASLATEKGQQCKQIWGGHNAIAIEVTEN